MSMSISIKKFNAIKDFAQFKKTSKQKPDQIIFKGKNQDNAETIENQTIGLKQSSTKNTTILNLQISFEKNFMDEHTETFDFFAQKYIRSVFYNNPQKDSSFLNESLFLQKSIDSNRPNQLAYYFGSIDCIAIEQKISIFTENLTHLEKFQEFLEYACSKCCDKVAFEIIVIAIGVWELFNTINQQSFSYEALIKHSKKLMEQNWESIKNNQTFQFINFSNTPIKPLTSNEEVLQELKKFLQYLITTMLLVAFEYFENPYYEEKIQYKLAKHVFYNIPSSVQGYESFSESQDSSYSDIFQRVSKKRK